MASPRSLCTSGVTCTGVANGETASPFGVSPALLSSRYFCYVGGAVRRSLGPALRFVLSASGLLLAAGECHRRGLAAKRARAR